MIRTQILLTPSLYDLLKLKAQTEGKSLSSIVRVAVEKHLVRKKRTGKEIFARMSKDIFDNPKTPRDLSTNDDYLYKLP